MADLGGGGEGDRTVPHFEILFVLGWGLGVLYNNDHMSVWFMFM